MFPLFCSVAGDSSKTAAEVLTAHVREISLPDNPDDPHQLITVRRRHIWSDTKRVFNKPYVDLILPVKVVFVGEQAEDEGGPKREFFRLALAAATSDPALFSGPCDRRVVQHNTTALLRKEFRHVGKLISMSVIQGGPGPMCFAPWIYDYLSVGIDGTNPEACDMPPDVQALFEEVRVVW